MKINFSSDGKIIKKISFLKILKLIYIFLNKGKITWDEFCTFMQLNFTEKEDTVKRKKEVVFITPARTENNPHRNAIQKVSCTSDLNYMIMSADGITSFWTHNGDLKRIKKDIVGFKSKILF